MADIKIVTVIDANNPVLGDMWFDSTGNPRLTNSLAEEVIQYLFISYKLFKGEWFLDLEQGVPWMQDILGKKIPVAIVQRILRQVAQDAPGVATVDVFTVTVASDRTASIAFELTLEDGTTLLSSDFAPFIIGGA